MGQQLTKSSHKNFITKSSGIVVLDTTKCGGFKYGERIYSELDYGTVAGTSDGGKLYILLDKDPGVSFWSGLNTKEKLVKKGVFSLNEVDESTLERAILLDIPKQFTVKEMIKIINSIDISKNYYYPDQQFLKEHYEIVKPYYPLINYYKGTGYKTVNSFYKTGRVYIVPVNLRQNIKDLFNLPTLPTGKDFWVYFERAMDDLYAKVKPLSRDIIVYRGVKASTVGQNFFNGDCLMSAKYPTGKAHRYCKPNEMIYFKYFNDKGDDDVRDYVYETLGFVSTGTRFSIATEFGCIGGKTNCDTILAMRLPAGTKFIMPLSKTTSPDGKEHYTDYESEFILFPLHNTFVIDQHGVVKYNSTMNVTYNIDVYYGVYCNELNMYRPSNMPKTRPLKSTKSTKSTKSKIDVKSLEQKSLGKCNDDKIKACEKSGKICNPATGKCLQPTAANIKKVGLTKPTVKKPFKQTPSGKCTDNKIEKCEKDGKICNPATGQCLQPTAANIKKVELSKPSSKKSFKQTPAGKCTDAKINACEKSGKICNPATGLCLKKTAANIKKVTKPHTPPDEPSPLIDDDLITEEKVLEHVITINAHGAWMKEEFVLPAGINLMVPHYKGLDQEYITEQCQYSYEEKLYDNGYFNYTTGWKLYKSGDKVSNMKYTPLKKNCHHLINKPYLKDMMIPCVKDNYKQGWCPIIASAGGKPLMYKGQPVIKIKACGEYTLEELCKGLQEALVNINFFQHGIIKMPKPIILVPFTCNGGKTNETSKIAKSGTIPLAIGDQVEYVPWNTQFAKIYGKLE